MIALRASARVFTRSVRAFDAAFTGEVPQLIYTVLRVGLALLVLVRSEDVLRAILPLDHHNWVRGFDFAWSIEQAPYLVSPLIPGLILGARVTWVLVRLRAALALALLVGIRPAWTALSLAGVSYALMFADRYRYFHHLHVLYLGIAWLASIPSKATATHFAPAWPLQILRVGVVTIYLAAGSAKLQPEWWSGDSLAILAHLGSVKGPIWAALRGLFGLSMLAKTTGMTELALPLLLLWPRTRKLAVLLGVAFHTLISLVMPVSTFGITMSLLLLSFWPRRQTESC